MKVNGYSDLLRACLSVYLYAITAITNVAHCAKGTADQTPVNLHSGGKIKRKSNVKIGSAYTGMYDSAVFSVA